MGVKQSDLTSVTGVGQTCSCCRTGISAAPSARPPTRGRRVSELGPEDLGRLDGHELLEIRALQAPVGSVFVRGIPSSRTQPAAPGGVR